MPPRKRYTPEQKRFSHFCKAAFSQRSLQDRIQRRPIFDDLYGDCVSNVRHVLIDARLVFEISAPSSSFPARAEHSTFRVQLLILCRTFKQIQFSILQIECNACHSRSLATELSKQIYIFIHEFQHSYTQHTHKLPTSIQRLCFSQFLAHCYCRFTFYYFLFC